MKKHDDPLLRQWAERQAPGPARLRALEARIVAAYRDHAQIAAPSNPRDGADTRHFVARRRGLLCFVAGIAATLLAIALWQVTAAHRRDLTPLLREEGGLFAGRQPALSRVFCETERLFGTNLQWVAQSGRNAELGLADEPTGAGKALIVHLSVAARRAGDGPKWRRVWQADVVARADGVVELAPDALPGNRVALWLHRLDDGRAFVESRLELKSPVRMQTESSAVLTFGASRDVMRVRHGDTEYLLLQTVSPTGGAPCST